MAKIYWTAEEQNKVVAHAKAAMNNGNVGYSSAAAAMRRAQEELLPVDRRKSKLSIYAAASILLVKPCASEGAKNGAKEKSIISVSQSNVCEVAVANRKAIAPIPVIPQPEPVVAIAAVTPIKEQINNIFTDMQTEINRSVNELVGAYAQQLRTMAMAEIQMRVDHALKSVVIDIRQDVDQEFQRRLKAATPKERVGSLYKVLIVGLIPAQKAEIIKEYGDSLNLDFVLTNEHLGRLKALKDNADYVLVMRKFVNHNHTDIVNKANHKGFIMINGGMTELSRSLLEIACK